MALAETAHIAAGQLVNYFQASTATLLVLDYFITFSDEVELIWGSGLGITKMLFLFERYLPFISTPLSVAVSITPNINPDLCPALLFTSTALNAVLIVIAELFFVVRIYTIWMRSKRVLLFTSSLATSSIIALIVILVIYMRSVSFFRSPYSSSGCQLTGTGDTRVISAGYVLVIVSESAILILNSYRARAYFKAAHVCNPLVTALFTDGLFYGVCMFVFSVVNITILFAAPARYSFLVGTLQSIMHAILATRMQLHLLRLDRESRYPSTGEIEGAATQLRFATIHPVRESMVV